MKSSKNGKARIQLHLRTLKQSLSKSTSQYYKIISFVEMDTIDEGVEINVRLRKSAVCAFAALSRRSALRILTEDKPIEISLSQDQDNLTR